LKDVLAKVVSTAVEGYEAYTLRSSASFRFLNDVEVGFVFVKGVLGLFSMARLESCLVRGWDWRRKA
jgi:hypothetical protein